MIERLRELRKQKKSHAYYAEILSKETGETVTVEEVRDLMKDLNESPELDIEGRTQKYNFDKGTVEVSSVYTSAPTPEQVIADHQIDTKKYKLSAYYSKGHPNGSFTVTALFRKIEEDSQQLADFQEFLKSYKSEYKPNKITQNPNFSDPTCLLLSLADFHLGKGDRVQVPLENRIKEYKSTVDTLLHRSYHSHNIDEIVFVVGNDLYQTDTVAGTTVKFTKVSESERWDNIYEIGFDLMVDTITKLKQFCNKLNIILTPGNHSESKEYYLTHALEVYFKQDKNIKFNRSSDKYKCYVYGQTALFFNHGDNINEKLPLMFAQSFREEWGKTKYHEVILGDKHHNSEKTFKSSQGEAQGVRMRILPSLTNLDQWHYDNLYTNAIQAGIALVYDKEKGKISEFEHRI